MAAARKIVAAAFALLVCVSAPGANLLEGHYQITSLVLTEDGSDRPRGFNNPALYIAAGGKRVRVVGAWRGIPVKRDAIVERTIGDTLVLRDTENPASLFKFHIRNNVITGRHALDYDDGTRQVINSKATVRRLDRQEVDRLRAIIDF